METQTTITANRAWEVSGYRLTSRVPGGAFLCDVGRELTGVKLRNLNQAFAVGVYLNRGPEGFRFRHDAILVHVP